MAQTAAHRALPGLPVLHPPKLFAVQQFSVSSVHKQLTMLRRAQTETRRDRSALDIPQEIQNRSRSFAETTRPLNRDRTSDSSSSSDDPKNSW